MHRLIIPLLILFLTACSTQTVPEYDSTAEPDISPYACNTDDDCICKGVYDNKCFIGNKDFYEKFVDKKLDCPAPDYCSGPYGNMVVRCVGKCTQMPG
ncbi:hypothetical protein KY359_06290 [Candidatus Woesearchaeota archaeon]|nr:hypothetical protein [Candidatus Woesearchaeota archaeon]